MKKIILVLFMTPLFVIPAVTAEECPTRPIMRNEVNRPPRPSTKEIKQLDKMIEQRLSLTPEQIKTLRTNRQKNLKELEKTINKMEECHKKIRNIYMLGLPAYQADIKSAPYKMELVILKQNADKIRAQNRKTFESLLTPEQKAEFKKLKTELPKH